MNLSRAVAVLACLIPLPALASDRASAQSFSAEIAVLFRGAACGSFEAKTTELDPRLDAKIIDAHCKGLAPLIRDYSEFWAKTIEPLLAQIVPREKGKTIVYPFGGGDLVTALGTYPFAEEITTLSLELTGDARGFASLTPERLKSELAFARSNLEKLYRVKHSRTENLNNMTHGGLSGELVFALTALRVRGAEPIALRYFQVTPDGTLAYLSEADVKKLDQDLAEKKIDKRQHAWGFANAEIEFRKVGETQSRFFRHIAANLDNDHVKKDPGVLAHLERKGRVFAITKAASYLLWWESFTSVRDYLLKNVDFMISDSTGLPPDAASAAGFTQHTFGDFDGPYLGDVNSRSSNLFKQLWRTEPHRALDFRYGYPDVHKQAHMLVTTKLEWSEPKLKSANAK